MEGQSLEQRETDFSLRRAHCEIFLSFKKPTTSGKKEGDTSRECGLLGHKKRARPIRLHQICMHPKGVCAVVPLLAGVFSLLAVISCD